MSGAGLYSLPFYPSQKEFLPPQLTSEGARVDPDWLMKFLKDPSLMQSGEKPPTPTRPAPAAASITRFISRRRARQPSRQPETLTIKAAAG